MRNKSMTAARFSACRWCAFATVPEAEVVQLPEQLQVHIAAHAGDAAVGGGRIPAAGKRAAGRRGGPAQQDVGQEWPPALLFEKRQRRLHLRLLRCQFGPMRQGDRDEVDYRLFEVDEFHEQLGRLQRLDLSRRIHAQQPQEFRTGHLPALAGQELGLLPAGQFGFDTEKLQLGHNFRSQLPGAA